MLVTSILKAENAQKCPPYPQQYFQESFKVHSDQFTKLSLQSDVVALKVSVTFDFMTICFKTDFNKAKQ